MSDDYISQARMTPLGPSSGVREGREYCLIDLGPHPLTRTAGDYNVMVPGFRGRIMSILVICDVATTDTDADGTITAEINGSAVTGGVVTIADVNDGSNPFNAVDKVFQGTLITANNEFDADDQLNFAWAYTNAFSDGVARVLFVCEAHID